MADPSNELLEMLLRECQATSPQPWYPSTYVKETGLDRTMIDAKLDHLRMAGLLRLTDWVQGNGQGYVLTPEGSQVLESPRLLRQLRDGKQVTLRLEPIEAPPGLDASPWERGEAVRNSLINPTRPRATLTLLFINILIFLIGLSMAMDKGVAGDYLGFNQPVKVVEIRHELGAISRVDVIGQGQWWRLVGYCFVHIGVLHLLMNMYFLYSLGPLVETMWGSVRFLALYLVSGIGGGVAVVLANQAAAGASGALCGVLASFGVWVFLNRSHLGRHLSSQWLRGVMTNVLLIVLISMIPGVSAMGHLGGGLAGAVIAVPLVYNRFGRGAIRWLGLLGAMAVPAACVGLVLGSITAEDRDSAGRAKIRVEMLEAQEHVMHARKLVMPILKDKDSAVQWFRDQGNIEPAKRAVRDARARLATAANAMRELDVKDADLRDAAQWVAGYCESYQALFDTIDRLLAAKMPPTRAEQASMDRDLEKANGFVGKLKNSAAFAR